MIRTTATADTSAIDGLISLLEDQDKVIAEVGQRVYNRVAPDALAELQREPGPVKTPIQWTSERQRKFVMAMLRKEDNLPYKRTHELSQGWTVRMVTQGAVFSIVIENPSEAAKFVYGSLAQNVGAAKRFQQAFHRNTGWQVASETATKWTSEFISQFKAEWKREITVRRRAFTKGTRRKS